MCAVAEEPTADNRQPSLKVIASICPILPDLALPPLVVCVTPYRWKPLIFPRFPPVFRE
jgi:hypothetical protein